MSLDTDDLTLLRTGVDPLCVRKVSMQTHEAIRSGIVFARQGIVLPAGVHIGNEAYALGWSMFTQGDSFALDKKIRASGWSFLFLAAEIKSIAFGQPKPGNFRRAIIRGLSKVPQEFNSAEVTEVAAKRLFGIPYIAVRIHARHIQEHMFLYSAEDQVHSAPRTAPFSAAVPQKAEAPLADLRPAAAD